MTAPAVDLREVAHQYGKLTALHPLMVQVEAGQLFGLVGPDGAGKTSLLRILATLILPTAGEARVLGYHSVREYRRIRPHLGYMAGRFALYQDLSIAENIRFFARVFRTTPEANYAQYRSIYEQLSPFQDRRAGALSGGMKQKLALCCALVHKPQLLLLDEPTTGVDAVSRQEFWDELARLRASGMTIVVSTPYMDEAARCDQILLLHEGKALAVDRPSQITQNFRRQVWAVGSRDRYALLLHLRQRPGTHSVQPFGEVLHYIPSDRDFQPEALLAALVADGFADVQITAIQPGIEDVFMDRMTQPVAA